MGLQIAVILINYLFLKNIYVCLTRLPDPKIFFIRGRVWRDFDLFIEYRSCCNFGGTFHLRDGRQASG